MKKVFGLIFILLTFYSLSAQVDTLNQTDASGKKQGYWKKYDKNKKLVYEGRFEKDVPVGTFTYYYTNGNKKSISNFLNGTHKVETIMFDENGIKAAEGLFIDQKKQGRWVYYAPDGTLIKSETYQNGNKDGEWVTFSVKTGLPLLKENYKDNQLEGERITYFTTGEISMKEQYVSGKLNGPFVSFYPDGKTASKGTYYQDRKRGSWEYYSQEGKVKKSTEYTEKINEEKNYLYFNNGGTQQKINQAQIAYIRKANETKIALTLKTGNTITFSENYDSLFDWIDLLVFIPVSKTILVAVDAIQGYEEFEKESVIVNVKPKFPQQIIAEGDYAKIVRSLFNTEIPVEE